MRLLQRFARLLREEIGDVYIRQRIASLLVGCLPSGVGPRMRAKFYGLGGMHVGRGVLISGTLEFATSTKFANIIIGDKSYINRRVFFDSSARIQIGKGVSVGHHVKFITTDHEVGTPYFRAGSIVLRPISVGDGAWIAAGAMILPGARIGSGAVVAAGAVVTNDVAANTLVGGVPAKVIRCL